MGSSEGPGGSGCSDTCCTFPRITVGACEGTHASRTRPFPNNGSTLERCPISHSSSRSCQHSYGSPSLLPHRCSPHTIPALFRATGLVVQKMEGDVPSHQLMALPLLWPQPASKGCFGFLQPLSSSPPNLTLAGRTPSSELWGLLQGAEPKVPVRHQDGKWRLSELPCIKSETPVKPH